MSILDSTDYAALGMIRPGTRVVLTDPVGFYDAGDRGTVQFNGVDAAECMAFVQFDEGATGYVPIFALRTEEDRAFHIRTRSGIGKAAFASEDDAADAAFRRGLPSFDVVEVKRAATYSIEQIPPRQA